MPKFANWNERDNSAVWSQCDELDLKAIIWIHASFVDDEIQDSLIPVISELKPSHATALVFAVIADKMDLSTSTFVRHVRERSCSSTLRDTCMRLGRRTRKRMFEMLLKLLVHIPRDQDPSELGALDALWVLWELCLGTSVVEDQDPYLHQSILNGVAELLSEREPFRLRRAAMNLLYESTHAWTYLYCPSAVGNIIAFARTCYRHDIAAADTFVKATTVVLLLSQWLDWNDEEAMPHHRQQLKGLLRDLARFLRQCNEDGRRYDERSAGKLVYGIAMLAEKDEELVNKMLPRVLLEGAELGLLDLTHEDRVMLRGM
ncbi:hypothetical protein C8Q80DRAFT_1100579 [Daedaleopsis nitida]|nr:hypothetical protein C8Q80DRAFT_1100579 [Daedaleopsis nitida]